MIRPTLPHIQWIGLLTIVSAMGLVLALSRCEQNPIITDFPGSQWKISDTSYSVVDTVLVRTPRHGGSFTLYTGLIDKDEPAPRESGILVKFASVDTSDFSGLQAAKLVLFRRTFADEQPEPGTGFLLNVIEVSGDEPDTIWAESDTGLTLGNFPNLNLYADSSMVIDTATVFVGGATRDSVLEYLAFPVNSLILGHWAGGSKANNGFLIRQESQGSLIGFHAREASSSSPSPYLLLTYADTTSAGGDTTRTVYRHPTADLSIYPWPNPDFDPTDSDSLLHLDHSSGLRSHVDFGPDFQIDTTRIIAGARLTLYVNQDVDVPPIVADSVDIRVLRRAKPLAQGDSTEVLISSVIYRKGSDNLVLKLGGFLSNVTAGVYENFGLDLVVIPKHHDFDHLVFWGATAPDSLQPRLDVIYGLPYAGVP